MSLQEPSTEQGPLIRAGQPWIDPVLARMYDSFPFDDDLPLYLELAESEGGRVLEPACGSGRVLVPLAEAGHRVVGVDASPHMLARARAKLEGSGGDVARRYRLIEDDIRRFHVGERFDLAVIAVKSFAYLTTRREQTDVLRRVASHLRPGGLLALDLLNPRPEWVAEPAGALRQDLVEEIPGEGMLIRTEATVSTDLTTQIKVIRSVYEMIDLDGAVTKRVVEWPFRFTYRFEAELLLEAAGFEIEAVHGGYRREPFTTDSGDLMLLARRRERADTTVV